MSFGELITSVLNRGRLDQKGKDLLLRNISIYEQAFTSPSIDKTNNYEVLEQQGDAVFSLFLVTYFYKRFPQLNCPDGVKIVARLKINYASKQTFSEIAEKLGFWPHIHATQQEKDTGKKSLLEDVLEAFIGATVTILDNSTNIGIGYAVAYRILESLFDELHISLAYEDLFDPKSRLKEYFDKNKQLGVLQYTYDAAEKKVSIFRKVGNDIIPISTAVARLKSYGEQLAAQKAINILGAVPPKDYSVFCS
jgi:dsRNA-specific ribonuclease